MPPLFEACILELDCSHSLVSEGSAFGPKRGCSPMLRYRVKSKDAWKRLRTDKGGVVSFEYVMVAACIVGSVSAAFGVGPGGGVATALSSAVSAISAVVGTAVGS